MMVEATPTSPFIVTQAQFLFEVSIVSLNPPPHFGRENKIL
jgi:hypothetical protein